jgi:hypothetical protein
MEGHAGTWSDEARQDLVKTVGNGIGKSVHVHGRECGKGLVQVDR